MSLPIEAADPLQDLDRKTAVLEWAEKRLELGSPSATYITAGTWTVTPDAEDKTLLFTAEGAATVVLPAGDDVQVGFLALLVAVGAGGVTVDGAAVTVLGATPNMTIAQNEAIYIEKVGIDTWIVVGGTA